jgi:hypothetical protein
LGELGRLCGFASLEVFPLREASFMVWVSEDGEGVDSIGFAGRELFGSDDSCNKACGVAGETKKTVSPIKTRDDGSYFGVAAAALAVWAAISSSAEDEEARTL